MHCASKQTIHEGGYSRSVPFAMSFRGATYKTNAHGYPLLILAFV